MNQIEIKRIILKPNIIEYVEVESPTPIEPIVVLAIQRPLNLPEGRLQTIRLASTKFTQDMGMVEKQARAILSFLARYDSRFVPGYFAEEEDDLFQPTLDAYLEQAKEIFARTDSLRPIRPYYDLSGKTKYFKTNTFYACRGRNGFEITGTERL